MKRKRERVFGKKYFRGKENTLQKRESIVGGNFWPDSGGEKKVSVSLRKPKKVREFRIREKGGRKRGHCLPEEKT